MFSYIIEPVGALLRREDGRTAVEYAIAVNLVILLAIAGVTISGYDGRRAAIKVRDRVGTAYQSTHDMLRSLTWRNHSAEDARRR